MMKNNRSLKLVGIAVLGLMILVVAGPTGRAETTAVTLTASVVDQTCQGGDFVNVTMTATVDPAQQGVRFVWDFDNDGVFDTQPSANPTVTHPYPDEVTVTARVGAIKAGHRKADTVTFGTMRCGG